MTSQNETNLGSTNVNIVRLAEPKSGSRLISRAFKTETPLPRSRFAPKPNGNACYAGYQGKRNLVQVRGEFELSTLYCIYSVIRGR